MCKAHKHCRLRRYGRECSGRAVPSDVWGAGGDRLPSALFLATFVLGVFWSEASALRIESVVLNGLGAAAGGGLRDLATTSAYESGRRGKFATYYAIYLQLHTARHA